MKPIARTDAQATRHLDVPAPAQRTPASAALTGATNVPPTEHLPCRSVPRDEVAQRLRQRAPFDDVGEKRVLKAILHTKAWATTSCSTLTYHGEGYPREVVDGFEHLEIFRTASGQYLASEPSGPGPWPHSGYASRMDGLFAAMLEQVSRREEAFGDKGRFVRALREELGPAPPGIETDVQVFREVVARLLEDHRDVGSDYTPKGAPSGPAGPAVPARVVPMSDALRDDTVQRLRHRLPMGLAGEQRVVRAIVHLLSPLQLTLRVLGEKLARDCIHVPGKLVVFCSKDGHFFATPPQDPGPWPRSRFADGIDSLFDAVLELITRREFSGKGTPGEFVQMLHREADTQGTDLEVFRDVVTRIIAQGLDDHLGIVMRPRTPRPVAAPTPSPQVMDTDGGKRHAAPEKKGPLTARSAAAQIRASKWDSSIFDALPHFMTGVPGWPAGRALEIHAPGGLLFSSGPQVTDTPAVQLHLEHEHYAPILDGERRYVRADGNCLFTAAIVAMGAQDAAAFGTDVPTQWRNLREAIAKHVETHWDEIKPFVDREPAVRRRNIYHRTLS